MTPEDIFLKKAKEIVSEQVKKNNKLGIGYITPIATTQSNERKVKLLTAYVKPEHVTSDNNFFLLKIWTDDNLVRIEFNDPLSRKIRIIYLYLNSGFHALEVIEAWSKKLPDCI